jgi:trehalose monomycolate/heme transporter
VHTGENGWGQIIHRLRWPILVAAAGFLIFEAVWGTTMFGRLIAGGFDTPGSESARAAERAVQALGRQATDVAVVHSGDRTTVDDPAFADAVQGTLASLPAGSVTGATTFWNSGSPALVSSDRHLCPAVRSEHLRQERLGARVLGVG